MDLVIIKTPDPMWGQEAICYFNLRLINGTWCADVLFTKSRTNDKGLKTVPWSEISFVNDPKDEKKDWYFKKHIEDMCREIDQQYAKKKDLKCSANIRLASADDLLKKFFSGLN